MHEMTIAAELLEQVLDVARSNEAVRVESVDVECGEQRQIVMEALQMAWTAVTEDTVAEGALLNLSERPMAACCRDCGLRFRPAIDDYRCSRCGLADVDIVEGHDIILQSIVCHQADEPTD